MSEFLDRKRAHIRAIAADVNSGMMVDDTAAKYGVEPKHVIWACHRERVSLAGKRSDRRSRRPEGMNAGELMQWIANRCITDPKSGCMLWPAPHRGNDGYASMTIDGKSVRLHRLVCEHRYGVVLTKLQCACHSCDVRHCLNPSHLFIGTKKDNADDRDRKGRNINHCGEKHGMAKLKEKDVREIKDLIRCGRMTLDEIAAPYGAHRSTIHLIKHGKQWKSVP